MKQQQQISFDSLIINLSQHIKSNKSRLNSRYSLSYEQDVIQLHDSLIDQDLETQFQEITYAIRLSKRGLGEQPQRESLKQSQIPFFSFASNTIQIEVEDPNSFPNLVANKTQIPTIRFSKKPIFKQPITVMIILTSSKEIVQMRIYLQGKNQHQQVPRSKASGYYKNTYIFIGLITVYFQELQNLVIKYNQLSKTLLLFRSKMSKEINLSSVVTHQNAGLLFPEIQEQNGDQQLINYCVLLAQQCISYEIARLSKQNSNVIKYFYFLFSKYFKPHEQAVVNTFLKYRIPQQANNNYGTQIFLYFFYMIYRENAINKIFEFELLGQIKLNRRCRQILKQKLYQLFENGKCFKEFLLYIYFLVAINYQHDLKTIQSIAKYNILHQNQLQSKRVITKLLQMNNRYLKISFIPQVNEALIKNRQISFKEYLEIKLKGLRAFIDQQYSQSPDKLTSAILQLLNFLILKIKENNPAKQQFIQYSSLIKQIFVSKGRLIIKKQNLAQFLAKLKFVHRCSPQVGEMLLDCLGSFIFKEIPDLLEEHFEQIIHPLILKPQSPQENKLLVDFFQNKTVSVNHINLLLEIWLEKKVDLYNFLTIEFIILKFMAVNKCFRNVDLTPIVEMVDYYIKREDVNENRMKKVYIFCERMKAEMGVNEKKNLFQAWLDKFTSLVQ